MVDRHAVNRAMQVERLAHLATKLGWSAEAVANDSRAREAIERLSGERSAISDTTWVCLVIRLEGATRAV